jgi:hypothetical protein
MAMYLAAMSITSRQWSSAVAEDGRGRLSHQAWMVVWTLVGWAPPQVEPGRSWLFLSRSFFLRCFFAPLPPYTVDSFSFTFTLLFFLTTRAAAAWPYDSNFLYLVLEYLRSSL